MLLIVNVLPVNSSWVSLPVRARSTSACASTAISGGSTVCVADNGHQEPVVRDGATDVHAAMTDKVVTTP